MAASLAFIEYLGSATSTATPTQLDLVSTMASNATRATYPVSVGNYSISKAIKLSFSGAFTSVTNVRVYKSDGALVTGEVVNYGSSTTFHVPTGGSYEDGDATTILPTTDPGAGSPNITIGGTVSGTITDTENTTDYIYLQSSVTIQAISGTANSKTMTFTWTEV